MDEGPSDDVTTLLQKWSAGDSRALDDLMPLVYDELRRLARFHLSSERADHTLQSTALVHEAYLKLVNQSSGWQNRHHFYGVASQAIRRILVDHARKYQSLKRGSGGSLGLDAVAAVGPEQSVDLVALDRSLAGLEKFDAQKARIVELRYFGGMPVNEIASLLGLSESTVKREWTVAKAWLYHSLQGGEAV